MRTGSTQRDQAPLLALPKEIFVGTGSNLGILGHLTPKELARAAEVSRELERLSRSAELWRRHTGARQLGPTATSGASDSRRPYARYLAGEVAARAQAIAAVRAEEQAALGGAHDVHAFDSLCFERIGVLRMIRASAAADREVARLEAQKARLEASLAAAKARARED